jgi:glycosyltransferase involved in cell wall biosynthesis
MNNTYGVLVCTYNGEKYIEKQLESIVNQKLAFNEILIVDDGSTDKTFEILNEFEFSSDLNIRIIQRVNNVGPADNFLLGIKEMKSDWIAFCDQDDIWFDNKLLEMDQYLKSNSNCKMLFTNAHLINENDEQNSETDLWRALGFDEEQRNKFSKNSLGLLCQFPVVTGMCSMIHRAEAIEFGLSHKPLLHDEWLSFNFAFKQSLYFIDKPLAFYRIHSNQQVGIGGWNRMKILKKELKTKIVAPESDLQRVRIMKLFLKDKAGYLDFLNVLNARESHLLNRCRVKPFNIFSVVPIFYETLNLRYWKYSGGVGAIMKDSLRLVWGR